MDRIYFEARYYDPLSTRFISPDPLFAYDLEKCIESVVECNLYQYTGNNPVTRVDLDGLKADFLESNARHARAVTMKINSLKRKGYTNFQENVYLEVNMGEGETSTRVADIAAMKPGQKLTEARFIEIKTVKQGAKKEGASKLGKSILRKMNRIGSTIEFAEKLAIKVTRGATTINQVKKDVAFNEFGATIQSNGPSKGQKIDKGVMYWNIYQYDDKSKSQPLKLKVPDVPVIGGNQEGGKKIVDGLIK